MVLNCQDGARHDVASKSSTNVCTSSLCLISDSAVNKHDFFPSNPQNTLTIMQAQCKENHPNFVQLTTEFCNDTTNKATTAGLDLGNVEFGHMHDGKMICSILQCSQWNWKHHPHCLCSCKQGQGVRQNHKDHQCKMLTQKQHKELYNKSKAHFESRKPTEKNHRDWCDKSNK